jgi:putative ABC transport system substrate-binding protein
MKKNIFGLVLGASLLAITHPGQAQSINKIPVIGVFLPETASAYAPFNEAFVEGLRKLGYTVDQNILLEYRYTEGKRERLRELADELVRLKVDVLVVVGGTIAAAKQARIRFLSLWRGLVILLATDMWRV